MSNPLKKLFSQTAIYGLSSIIARFLNYLLVPLHTSKAVFSTDQFGIISEMYSYVGFLIIFLTYGMETAYFRFSSVKTPLSNTYSTIITSLLVSTSFFVAMACIFADPIAIAMKYPNNAEFVIWFAFIVGLDAISSIPLARLRKENKAWKFVMVNFVNVFTNIGLNLFFLAYCMPKFNAGETNWLIETFYNPELGVSYVFISNLIASIIKFAFLSPMLFIEHFKFSKKVFIKAIAFSAPLLIAGLAGIANENIDKIMIKHMLFDSLGEQATMTQVGIYGACYKISIIITLFIQAFRYAAEPFFFNQSTQVDSKKIYATVMHYFVIVCAVVFLAINLFMDYIKFFIPNEDYWVGLDVVPILLLANVFLGIYYNLAIWFKLTNKTIYGAYIGIFGALITLSLNYVLIPDFSYMGSAWATLACYFSMCVVSLYLGRKYFPIPYKLGAIFEYLAIAVGLFFLGKFLQEYTNIPTLIAILLTLGYIAYVLLRERINPFKFSKS